MTAMFSRLFLCAVFLSATTQLRADTVTFIDRTKLLEALTDKTIPCTALSTQADAEAGTNNTTCMTPLRTKQAIDALAPGGTPYGRAYLTSDLTIHVATTGNDTTGDGTSGTPFATVPFAANHVATKYDAGGKKITVKLADGTYNFTTTWSLPNVIGINNYGVTASVPGDLVLEGNTTNPENVILSGASVTPLRASGITTVWSVQGVKLEVTGSGSWPNVDVTSGAHLRIGKVHIGPSLWSQFFSQRRGHIEIFDTITIANGGISLTNIQDGSVFDGQGRTFVFPNAITYSMATIYGDYNSTIMLHATTWTNAGNVSGPKYLAEREALIFSNGIALPGSTAGSVNNGGRWN